MKIKIPKTLLLLGVLAGFVLSPGCSLFITSKTHYYSNAATAPPKKVLPQIYDEPAGYALEKMEFNLQLNKKGYFLFAWIDLDAPPYVSNGDLRTKLIREAAAAGADVVVAATPTDIKYDGYIPAHREQRQNLYTGKWEMVDVPATNTKEKARLSTGYLFRHDPTQAMSQYKYNRHFLNTENVFRALDGLAETSYLGKREKIFMLEIERKIKSNIGPDDNYSEAMNRLKQLMLLCDGCLKYGRPDSDDYIINCDGQAKVYPVLLIAYNYIAR